MKSRSKINKGKRSIFDRMVVRLSSELKFIELTLQEREVFVKALLNPGQPSKKAIAAAKRYKQRLGL
jgi:hypothetical protein